MRDMEMKGGHSSVRIMSSLLITVSLLISIISCKSDSLKGEPSGLLQIDLRVDTTGMNESSEITKSDIYPEMRPFLNTDQYKIEILQGSEGQVMQAYDRYLDMPDVVEVPRGSYKFRASMGSVVPASFEAPYVEGTTDFIIKDDMKTKLNITCSLLNARVAVAYTDSFCLVYPTHTTSISTSHTTEPLEYVQEEFRAGWFQVDKDGESLKGILTVKPDTGEVKKFTFTMPDVKPKDNVKIIFNSSQEQRPDRGLTVKVTINDETKDVPVYVYVPDYMLPVDAAILEAHGFAHEDPIVLGASDIVSEANVKMFVPGTIENCVLTMWEDKGKAEEFDLAHLDDEQKAFLSSKGLNIPDIWRKKQVALDFKSVIDKLPRIAEGSTDVKIYNYQLVVTDSLVVPHVSKPLTLAVKMIPDVAPKIELSDNFISSSPIKVTEGGVVYDESGSKIDPKYQATIKASTGIKTCLLKITDASGRIDRYNLTEGDVVAGIKYDLSAATPYVNLKEVISSLVLDDDNIKRYEYELTVQTEFDGSTYEDVKTFIVDLIPPKFEMSMNDDKEENGDAFAKRAVLRAKAKTGDASKLKFQLFENGQWIDVEGDRVDGNMAVSEDVASIVLKRLKPQAQYKVRAKYGKHVSAETTFTTEEEMYLPSAMADLEEWNYTDGPKATGLAALAGKGPYWKHWYPRSDKDETKEGWCTLNNITTQDYVYCAYESNSGTIRTTDKSTGAYAAEIRTIGWGEGTTAASPLSTIKHINPGQLFLGKVSGIDNQYGYTFDSRPTAISFDYKYISKGTHQFTAKVVLKNKDKTIGEVTFNGAAQNSYITKKIYIDYSVYLKATSLNIIFISGDNTKDEVDTASVSRSSEHVGNRLFVDNVSIIYE